MENNPDFFGTGWNFPPSFNKKGGSTNTVTGEEDIRQSLEILLKTHRGERLMLPDYGTELAAYVFKVNQMALGRMIGKMLESRITEYESRIKVHDLQVDTKGYLEGVLSIYLDYTIRQTNARRNAVFPFFLGEGNLVPSHLTDTKSS